MDRLAKILVLSSVVVFTAGWLVGSPGSVRAAEEKEFAYSGDFGPGFWGKEFSPDCDGSQQSPINIDHVFHNRYLKRLDLDLHDVEIHLTNNGHTIEQEYEGKNTLEFHGEEYTLLQFHFHTLAEHTVQGRRGVMELHAVFKNDDTGKLAVIGQIYHIGRKNRFLQKLIDAGLPAKKGDLVSATEEINLRDGLEDTKSYYTYSGSLTTPPCSEIVTWIVLQEWASLSKEQYHAFRDILGNNFRPLQARDHRKVQATVNDHFHGH